MNSEEYSEGSGQWTGEAGQEKAFFICHFSFFIGHLELLLVCLFMYFVDRLFGWE